MSEHPGLGVIMVLYHIPMISMVKQEWKTVKKHLLFGLLVRHNDVYVIVLPISIVRLRSRGTDAYPSFPPLYYVLLTLLPNL